jgi:hypothetical protein
MSSYFHPPIYLPSILTFLKQHTDESNAQRQNSRKEDFVLTTPCPTLPTLQAAWPRLGNAGREQTWRRRQGDDGTGSSGRASGQMQEQKTTTATAAARKWWWVGAGSTIQAVVAGEIRRTQPASLHNTANFHVALRKSQQKRLLTRFHGERRWDGAGVERAR